MRRVCCWSSCAATVRRLAGPLQNVALAEQVYSPLRHCSRSVAFETTAPSATSSSHEVVPPPAATSTTNAGSASSAPTCTVASLNKELTQILHGPVPVGTTFQRLSKPAQAFLTSQKIGLEQHLLREPELFRVFQEPGSKTIMACRTHHMPSHALRGVEATPDRLFSGAKDKPALDHITMVLKYIPNEWSPFVELGVPESIRVNVMGRKAKAWFEKHPQYFEVQSQSVVAHTFQVRRALSLQKQLEDSQLRSTGDVQRMREK